MRSLLFGLVVLITACSRGEPVVFEHSILVFGTRVDITLADVERDQALAAVKAVEQQFEQMHAVWHAWEPGSLGRINQLLPTGGRFAASPAVLPLIQESQRLAAVSDGYFNPAIGKLVALWGFHREDPENAPEPDAAAIQALIDSAPSMADIEIDGLMLKGNNPDIKLDFGGLAKGYAVQLGLNTLKEHGVEHAIINAGGDLGVIGQRGQRPWRIGIQNPALPGVIAALEVAPGESVFTSGSYERGHDRNGKRVHHIINPLTGYPATETLSVTVIHPDATTADAAATALFVAGPQKLEQVARAMGIEYVFLVASDGSWHMNPAMRERLILAHNHPAVHLTAPLVQPLQSGVPSN